MDKSVVMNIILILLLMLQVNCTQEGESFIIKIEDATKESFHKLKLKKVWGSQKMVVLENTLDDTCLIGIMKVPPKITGTLYKSEFFSDSIAYPYYPYKAKHGKLIIKHSFMDY